VSHPPASSPAPRAARRWALPPLHFLERWEAGLPPVHFCGRNSHLSTAGHTERMAATPLRPRHRCEAHTNPHHSWRQRKPCVKISHPLVDGADTTRLVEKPFPRQWRSDAGQWRTMSGPQDVGAVVVPEEQRGGARVRGVMAKFGRGINQPKFENLQNIRRSGNRGAPMVPGSLPGHATGSQMVQLGSSRRVTLYSASITASARPPAPPGQWWRSCGWA
jgi:hypothetical protein